MVTSSCGGHIESHIMHNKLAIGNVACLFKGVRWRKMCSEMEKVLPVSGTNSNRIIGEGSAKIEVPAGKQVFYNPVQEFNRDLSISALKVVSAQYAAEAKDEDNKSFRILEAFSATGLRSIRYAKEVPNVTEVIANDISQSAVEIIERNIKINDVTNIVKTSCSDAVDVMFNHRHRSKRFDIVDLDPYGSPAEFLDTAVQSVKDGGLLMVTCTDMAILCGNTPQAGFVKYGSLPLKGKYCHEMALRIVLYAIQCHASKYKRYIVPLLSVSVDFYIRLFIKLYTSPRECKNNISKTAMVYRCTTCDSTHLQPFGIVQDGSKNIMSLPAAPVVSKECSICGGKHNMGGPIWSAPIHDPNFVTEVLNVVDGSDYKTKCHLFGILNVILEELNDIPLYYNLNKLCSTIKTRVIPMIKFRSAFLNAGYRISYSHACQSSVKTDAPLSFIWDVLREWAKSEGKLQKLETENGPAQRILNKECTHKIDLSKRCDAQPLSKKNKLKRFPEKPPHWGPGARSQTNTEISEKKNRNQNKKKRRGLEPSDESKSEAKKVLMETESSPGNV